MVDFRKWIVYYFNKRKLLIKEEASDGDDHDSSIPTLRNPFWKGL